MGSTKDAALSLDLRKRVIAAIPTGVSGREAAERFGVGETIAENSHLATHVNAVLAELGGDHRAAIRAMLHDVAALAADYELSVSRGYVRRDTIRLVNVSHGVNHR